MPFLLLWVCVAARAYDFSAVVPSGQTLYFNLVAGGVEVVFPNNTARPQLGWNGYAKPTGSLTVPSAVQHDGVAYPVVAVRRYAFRQCTGLTAVTLSEGVALVDTGAFYGCSGVTTLRLPSSLAVVCNGAFALMASLGDVWVQSAVPPTTSAAAFNSVDLGGCVLHVPCGGQDAYGNAAPWGSFGTIQAALCEATLRVAANDTMRGTVTGGGTYAQGTMVVLTAFPAAGYRFVCWNDGDTLNPRVVALDRDSGFTAMFLAVADTVYVRDTLMPDFFRLSVASDNPSLGLGVGSAWLPAGTEVEVCGLPLEGGRFVGWDDGEVVNPRRLTLTGTTTLTAHFERLAADAVDMPRWSLAVAGRRLTLTGGGGATMRIYDAQGRCLSALPTTDAPTCVDLPSAGVWFVQLGDSIARKIVTE